MDTKSQNTVSGLGCGQSFLEEGDDHYNLRTMLCQSTHFKSLQVSVHANVDTMEMTEISGMKEAAAWQLTG